MATLMAMTESVSLAEVKNRLSEYVDRVEREHERVVITKHGRPAAVVISIDDLESLEETLAIMSNPELMARIREADADVKAGRVERLSKAELLASLAR
jgi:antitoxin YefM